MTITVSIVQPNFIPWLGLFDMIDRADVHVFYDDEQYVRKGWGARNRVRGANDQPAWLSIPIAHPHTTAFPMLNEAQIAVQAGDWQSKHLGALRQWYRKAANLAVLEQFEAIIRTPYACLADLNIAIIEWMCEMLDIRTPMQRVSLMDVPQDFGLDQDVTTLRPLEVCRRLGAEQFLCGPTAKRYINPVPFQHAGVELVWHAFGADHPVYVQHREPFIPFLSALDFLLEHGPRRPSFFLGDAP